MYVKLLLLCAFSAVFADISEENGVLVLTVANFDGAIADNKYILVEFCKYFFFYRHLLSRVSVYMWQWVYDNTYVIQQYYLQYDTIAAIFITRLYMYYFFPIVVCMQVDNPCHICQRELFFFFFVLLNFYALSRFVLSA